jgi:hypothetical protein
MRAPGSVLGFGCPVAVAQVAKPSTRTPGARIAPGARVCCWSRGIPRTPVGSAPGLATLAASAPPTTAASRPTSSSSTRTQHLAIRAQAPRQPAAAAEHPPAAPALSPGQATQTAQAGAQAGPGPLTKVQVHGVQLLLQHLGAALRLRQGQAAGRQARGVSGRAKHWDDRQASRQAQPRVPALTRRGVACSHACKRSTAASPSCKPQRQPQRQPQPTCVSGVTATCRLRWARFTSIQRPVMVKRGRPCALELSSLMGTTLQAGVQRAGAGGGSGRARQLEGR